MSKAELENRVGELTVLLTQALEALEETGIRWPLINKAIQDIKKDFRKNDPRTREYYREDNE